MIFADWIARALPAITMPCFGTTGPHPFQRPDHLPNGWARNFMEIPIGAAVNQHFAGHRSYPPRPGTLPMKTAQARERTQVLMDLANKLGGIVIGTGDLSELALGWATYNGDHMSMYGGQRLRAQDAGALSGALRGATARATGSWPRALLDILDTPVSPGAAAPGGRRDRPEDRGSGGPL